MQIAADDYVAKVVLAKQLLDGFEGKSLIPGTFIFGGHRGREVLQNEEPLWIRERYTVRRPTKFGAGDNQRVFIMRNQRMNETIDRTKNMFWELVKISS